MKQNNGLISSTTTTMEVKKEKNYNIVLVLLDGARLDRLKLQPNFQKLSQEGTFFSKMITYGAQTVMSMHATFTGIYGNINGADNYFGSALFKKDKCKTLASYMKESGYYTLGDTINEIVVPPQGFDELLIHDENNDDLTERHKNLLHQMNSKRKEGKNFFLYMHYSNIHTGMVKTVLKKYGDFEKSYFENKEKNTENYDSYIKEADKYLSNIFEEFKKLGMSNDTIFILMSDHGASVGDKIGEIGYGRYCYDYTMSTFSVFIQPEIFPSQKITKLCRTVDILPTLLDVNKIAIDETHQKPNGFTIMPLLNSEEDNRISYSESAGMVDPYPTKEKPLLKAVRTSQWKFIYNRENSQKELYNLIEDPGEDNNLISKNIEISNKLFEELKKLSPEVK